MAAYGPFSHSIYGEIMTGVFKSIRADIRLISSETIIFADGSVGKEWGPIDGSNIQREIVFPRGFAQDYDENHPAPIASPTPTQKDWDNCDAAEWVKNAGSDWTVVHEPIFTYHGRATPRRNGLGFRERRITWVKPVVHHE